MKVLKTVKEKTVLVVSKIRPVFLKIKELLVKIWAKIKSFLLSEKMKRFFSAKATKAVTLFLLLIFVISQIVFGILIYGFKSEDKITRVVAKIIPFPVAVVNQDFISYDEYLSEKDYIHHFYGATQQGDMDYTEVDKQIMNQIIEDRLISFESLIHWKRVKKSEIDLTMKDIVDQNGGEEKVTKVLNDLYGLNLNQFRKLVKSQMLRDKLDQDLIARVTASHILVRVDKGAPDDQVAAAKAKIDGYLAEIKGGVDFAEEAKKHSEDVGSAENGGALEPFAAGEMVKEFSDVAFKTKVGEISEPVRTDFGWHIIKVEAKKGTIEKSFGDWLDGIKKKSLIINFFK